MADYTYKDVEMILKTTLDGLQERKMLSRELCAMTIVAAYYKALFYNKTELSDKLKKQITINNVNPCHFKSLMVMWNEDSLTNEEFEFCNNL